MSARSSELTIDGRQRKVVFTAGKMALYDVLDAATGQYLDSLDTGIQNMISAIDPKTGDKTLHPNAIPNTETGYLLCPICLVAATGSPARSTIRTKCCTCPYLKFA